MGLHRQLLHPEALGGIQFPEWLAPFGELVAAPDVVDQDVETIEIAIDAIEQSAHFIGNRMVDANRDADAAGRGHQLGRFYSLKSARGRRIAARASAGA